MNIDEIKHALISVRSKLVKGDTSVEADLDDLLIHTQNIHFVTGEIKCYEYLGGVYRMKGDYNKALGVYKKGYALALEHNDEQMLPIMINWLGSAYFFLGDYKKSFDLASESLLLFDKLKMYHKKSDVLINLGQRHNVLGNLEKAEKYLLQALDVSKGLEDDSETWTNYYSIAQFYEEVKEDEKSQVNYKKSLELAERFNSEIGLIFNLEKKGSLLLKSNSIKAALKVLNEALTLAKKNQVASSIVSINLQKSSCLIQLGNIDDAETLLQEIVEDEKTDKRKLSIAYDRLHELNLTKKDFEKSLTFLKKHMSLENELQSVETKKHIETTEAKYQNQLKESEKEILRLQKIEMEQKAIRAQLNPHFFFNALNSINKFIIDNDQQNASKFLQNFSGLMRKTLENSEEMFITVEDEVAFLKDYLSLEQLRCNNSFTFYFEIDEEIEEDFVKIPTMMLQPYVENCIKHGVAGLNGGIIKISFSFTENERILCTIEDNGKGRTVNKNHGHISMGTRLLEERIFALKNQFSVDFSIEIIDLKDKQDKPSGTRVEVSLPSTLNNLIKA